MSTVDPTRKSADERRAIAKAKDYMAKAGDVYDRLGRALLAKDSKTARALFAEGAALEVTDVG